MAFKGLFGGNDGNFKNAADYYGYFNDTVYAAYEPGAFGYNIYTYRGADLIDLRDAGPRSLYSVLAGSGNDTILGTRFDNNYYYDQSGNDRYQLGVGKDSVYAGSGNDTVDGGQGMDSLSFLYIFDDNGSSEVSSFAVRVDLSLTKPQDFGFFGRDVIRNIENLSGGQGADILSGNGDGNSLSGNQGNDYLRGRGGNDQIYGDFGADTLIGDKGIDMLVNDFDLQRDIVRFLKITDSTVGIASGTTDTIVGFDSGGTSSDDKIDLSPIDARAGTAVNDAFVFRGVGGSFSSRQGEVRIVETGGNSIVFVDNDRDAAAEMTIFVQGVTGLTAADFIL